jgi:hypothetical protein
LPWSLRPLGRPSSLPEFPKKVTVCTCRKSPRPTSMVSPGATTFRTTAINGSQINRPLPPVPLTLAANATWPGLFSTGAPNADNTPAVPGTASPPAATFARTPPLLLKIPAELLKVPPKAKSRVAFTTWPPKLLNVASPPGTDGSLRSVSPRLRGSLQGTRSAWSLPATRPIGPGSARRGGRSRGRRARGRARSPLRGRAADPGPRRGRRGRAGACAWGRGRPD